MGMQPTFGGNTFFGWGTKMSKGRMEAFSDGVIAILITIMVLELTVPRFARHGRLHTMRLSPRGNWPGFSQSVWLKTDSAFTRPAPHAHRWVVASNDLK